MPDSSAEPPWALVLYLLNDCRYRDEVGAAALSGLARDGFLQTATGPDQVRLPAAAPAGRALLPFEQAVLARVQALAGDGAALTLEVLGQLHGAQDDEAFAEWQEQFCDRLGRQAAAAGLAARSMGRAAHVTLAALLGASALVAAVLYAADRKDAGDGIGLFLFVGVVALVSPVSGRRWRLTRAGAQFAAAWRPAGPDRGDRDG